MASRNIVINREGEMIKPEDYEAKCKKIIEQLDEELFTDITPESTEDVTETATGVKKKKKKFSGDEIMPLLTPLQVSLKFEELLLDTMTFDGVDAKALEPKDYLNAYKWYTHLLFYINKYITLPANKQHFCAFANITTEIYNDFLKDSVYMQVFKRIDDGLVGNNFIGSQAGLVDSKTTISKLQMKDAGHNLVKNADALPANDTRKEISQEEIDRRLESWTNIIKQIGGKK